MSTLEEMKERRKGRPDDATVKKVLEFLFQKGELEESQFLDTRTDINSKEMFTAILHYRILDEYYECSAAEKIADLLERLLISSGRMGRKEAVAVLLQPQPEEVTVLRGMEKIIADASGREEKKK